MTKPIVLDASALIALIYQENGGDLVEKYLPNAEISTVNLAEVATYMIKQGLDLKEAVSLLKDLSIPAIDFDEEQAFIAAQLLEKTNSKGLSLGDRACLALGMRLNQMVLTADKIWQELDLAVKIKLIR
jgi:ribonuclease VapC